MMCYELTIIYRQRISKGFLDHKAISRWGTLKEAEEQITRSRKFSRRKGSLIRVISADIEHIER